MGLGNQLNIFKIKKNFQNQNHTVLGFCFTSKGHIASALQVGSGMAGLGRSPSPGKGHQDCARCLGVTVQNDRKSGRKPQTSQCDLI